MAIPIVPIVAIAALAMLAGGGGRKKKASSRRTPGGSGRLTEGTQVFVPMGTVDPEADPVFGAICSTEQGVWSAYNTEGECLVFWDDDTDAAMTYYIKQAFEDSGHSLEDACAPAPGWQGDPFDPTPEVTATWIPNQIQIDILKLALADSYPQIPSNVLPPSEVRGPGDEGTADYVEVVWTFAMSIFLREICGYMPVT